MNQWFNTIRRTKKVLTYMLLKCHINRFEKKNILDKN